MKKLRIANDGPSKLWINLESVLSFFVVKMAAQTNDIIHIDLKVAYFNADGIKHI